MRENKTGKAKLRGAALKQAVVELRMAGLSYTKIAAELGCSRSMAHKHVTNALKEHHTATAEAIEEMRSLWNGRHEAVLAGIWSKAKQGNLGAVDRFVKISGEVAKLNGLYAPAKVAPTDPEGKEPYEMPTSEAEIAERISKIITAAADREADKS